jgi:hypothetical protein
LARVREGLEMLGVDADVLGEVPGNMTVYHLHCTVLPVCTMDHFHTVRVAGTPPSPVGESHLSGVTPLKRMLVDTVPIGEVHVRRFSPVIYRGGYVTFWCVNIF